MYKTLTHFFRFEIIIFQLCYIDETKIFKRMFNFKQVYLNESRQKRRVTFKHFMR